MAIRIPWDKYETALLIEAFLRYETGEIPKNQAVSHLSHTLRERAKKNGVEIDQIFRNENGIIMQWSIVSDLINKNKCRLHGASKVFIDMVELYQSNKNEFEKILAEAKRMGEYDNKIEDRYLTWLSSQVTPAQMPKFILAYSEIEVFCFNTKILKRPLLETTNLDTLTRVKQIVDCNKLFCCKYKKHLRKMAAAIEYYNLWVAENQQVLNDNESDDITDSPGSAFYTTLSEKQDSIPENSPSYVSELNNCESFTNSYDIGITQYISSSDYGRLEVVNDALLSAQGLPYRLNRATVHKNNNYENGDISIKKQSIEETIVVTPYKKVLSEEYKKGFRIRSGLEMKRFRNFWKVKYDSELIEDDATIRKIITQVTIHYKDRVYLPEEMLDTRTQAKLLFYINQCFLKGKKAIYLDALYNEFANDFRGHRINNVDMLKTYLAYINEGNYFINKCYLAADQNVEADPTDEVRDYLVTLGAPIQMDALYEALSHIPVDKINCAVYGSNSDEFVRNQKGEYFHADIVDLIPLELNNIADLIQQAIDAKDFMGGNELVDIILDVYPSIQERYPFLTPLGMRDAIGYKLREVFSFKGKIISALGQDISMTDVFADFVKSHVHFSLGQLNTLKNELETPIYFLAVYANSLRISKDMFVSKNQANFNVNETDVAIDRFCTGDYITISEISHFGSFPYAGFPWNSYLLEHYVSDYSKKYKLVHSGFNAKSAVGAIVKRTSKIEDFGELITSALADSKISLNIDDALQYLCDNGFLARRSYGDIENILDRASVQRRKKG